MNIYNYTTKELIRKPARVKYNLSLYPYTYNLSPAAAAIYALSRYYMTAYIREVGAFITESNINSILGYLNDCLNYSEEELDEGLQLLCNNEYYRLDTYNEQRVYYFISKHEIFTTIPGSDYLDVFLFAENLPTYTRKLFYCLYDGFLQGYNAIVLPSLLKHFTKKEAKQGFSKLYELGIIKCLFLSSNKKIILTDFSLQINKQPLSPKIEIFFQ